jgi:hypothetical protein
LLDCLHVSLFKNNLLPHYFIPLVVSVIALSIAGKLDKPMRKNWPRPHSITYMMILTTIFVWFVPMLMDTVSTFWARLAPSLEHYSAMSILRDSHKNIFNNTTAASPSPSSAATANVDALYSSAKISFFRSA